MVSLRLLEYPPGEAPHPVFKRSTVIARNSIVHSSLPFRNASSTGCLRRHQTLRRKQVATLPSNNEGRGFVEVERSSVLTLHGSVRVRA